MPSIFEDEQPPSLIDQLRAILHSFAMLTPHEYVALIEYVRPDPKTGRQRTLDGVTKTVSEILHERQISFQLCDMWIESARKKLAAGANFAAASLKMHGRG